MSRVQADIVEWFDNKGYGFARQLGGTERIFVHAKSLKGRSRLKRGEHLELEIITGRNGKPAAQNVIILDAKQLAQKLSLHLATAALILIIAQLLVILGKANIGLLAIYAIMGLFSLLLYRRDKQAALFGWWRIREWQLLGVDLFGGIVGGLLAQHKYRHKMSKQSYQIKTLFIVSFHAVILSLIGMGII